MKTDLILLMYDELCIGKSFTRQEFCRAHFISERTFYRYLREIGKFLNEHKPAFCVHHSESDNSYSLIRAMDLSAR